MPPKDQTFFIKSYLNGLCLDVDGGSTKEGAKVIMWHAKPVRDAANQLWYVDPNTNTIRNSLTGFCLEVDGEWHLAMSRSRETGCIKDHIVVIFGRSQSSEWSDKSKHNSIGFEAQSYHGITVTSYWTRRRLKSVAWPLFTQLFIQAQIKESIKAPLHWPLCGNSPVTGEFPAQMASNAENFSIWWRHHVRGSVLFRDSWICSLPRKHHADIFPLYWPSVWVKRQTFMAWLLHTES